MILHDRWPGDPGRKQKSLSKTKLKIFSGPINNTLVAGTSVSTTTTPSMNSTTMTGSITGDTAVITMGSNSILSQPVLPAQSAPRVFPCPSTVSTVVQDVVIDAAQCYNTILVTTTYSATVTGSCTRPVMSLSGPYSSVIHQLSAKNWRENARQ